MRDPSVPEPRIERFSSRLVVQSWFQVAFAVLAVFAVLGSIVGGIFIQRTVQITDEVTGRIQPAMTESYRLQSSLLDQQTAVRGYALTTDPIFLGPYRAGRADQQVALDRLRELLADHPELLADIDSIDATARQWQTQYAERSSPQSCPGSRAPSMRTWQRRTG